MTTGVANSGRGEGYGSSRDLSPAAGIALEAGALSGFTVHLTAKHCDPIMDEGVHEHTWAVTIFYPAKPLRDGRAMKAGLRQLLDHLPNADGLLPPELWSGEAMAQTVAQLLTGCIGCRVARAEGFEAWVWL